MFEELSTGPLGKLSDLIYRWRGIDSWPTATATVYTCEFHEGGRGPSQCKITFSYRAAGELQDGSYYEQGPAGSPPFQPGDTFTIKWNPKHPNRFYTASSNSEQTTFGWVLLLFVAALLLVVFLLH